MDEDTYSSLEDAEFKEAFDEFDKVGYRDYHNAAQQEECALHTPVFHINLLARKSAT